MASKTDITADYVRSILDYDPATGIFRWKHRTDIRACDNARMIGKIAGSLDKKGYRRIIINRRNYAAHRLAWLYTTGEWPIDEVDHKNLNKDDNRFKEIREATSSDNGCNRQTRADSGTQLRGIYLDKRYGGYVVKIQRHGKRIYLGTVSTAKEAIAVYATAAEKLHGEFKRLK